MATWNNIDHLEIVLDVLRFTESHGKGAVRHVAKARRLEGSVVSNALARIQERLSCRLVILSGNAPGLLTPEGRRFLNEAPAILNGFRVFLNSFGPLDARTDQS